MSLTQETIALSQIEKQRRSYQALSLTNYDNNLEPQIAAGGRVEDTDTLFYSGSLESITGWAGIAVSTAAYIRIVPQGDGPPETALAEFTDVAPTWSDSKQGFYDATVAKRYIGGLYKDSGGLYTKKYLYDGQQILQHSGAYITALGGINLDGASRVRVTKNDAQSIPNATVTIVQYDDEDFDNLGEFASYAFTAKEAGYYCITASLQLIATPWAADQYFEIRIYKNAAIHTFGSNEMNWSGVDNNLISKVNDLVYLAATDYVDIRAYQNSGGAINTGTDANMNYFSVHRLS